MSEQPLLSIIVPVYNVATHLDRCVESLIMQTYPALEVLLIDDGSTDLSGEICDNFEKQDPRVRAIHIPNGGVSRARNLGIKASRGEFIQFVDSDDYLDLGMSALLVEAQRAENADLVITGYLAIDEASGRQHRHVLDERHVLDHQQFVRSFTSLRQAGLLNSSWNKLYRKSVLSSKGVQFDESMEYAEDVLFNLRYFAAAQRVVVLDETPYTYIRYASGQTLSGRFHLNRYRNAKVKQQAIRELFEGAGVDSSAEERDYTLHLATELAPYFAKHLGKFDYRAYIVLASEMRSDPTYQKNHAALSDIGWRNRALLILFHSSRFEALYFLGWLSRSVNQWRRHSEGAKKLVEKKC